MTKKLILLFLLAQISVFANGPQIVIDNPIFDFGIINEGDTVIEHTFIIRNSGNKNLKITKVKSTCSCTIADYDSIIAPNDSGIIKAKFETLHKRAKQNKRLKIISNSINDNDKIKEVAFKGFIMGDIIVSQRYAFYRPRNINTNITDTITFSTAKSNIKIKKIIYRKRASDSTKVKDEKITFKVKKINKDEFGFDNYRLIFKLNKKVEKVEKGEFTFYTNHPKKKVFTIRTFIENQATKN